MGIGTVPRNQFSLVLLAIKASFQKGGSVGFVLLWEAPFLQPFIPSLASLARKTDLSREG